MHGNYHDGLHESTGTSRPNTWRRVNRQEPCPVCGKHKNCCISDDGGAVFCGDISEGSVGTPNNGGQWLHIREPWQTATYTHPSHRQPAKPRQEAPTVDVTAMMARLTQTPERPAKLRQLATSLGVSVESLELLGVGYGEIDGGSCWAFPEYNGEGVLVGINRRFENGFKRSVSGGRRGLTYHDAWDLGGPLFLIEGGSDTAALVTMGLSAIGRPSNNGGIPQQADLIEAVDIDDDRLIVVVAEDDRLKDGKPRKLPPSHSANCGGCESCWPGLSGAKQTAKQLAEELRRPFAWALPPDGAKDAREWLNAQPAGEDAAELGQRFQSGLLAGQVMVEPSARMPVVTVPEDDRPIERLDLIRELMKLKRVESIGVPGVNLCRAGTGTGKTTAGVTAAVEAVSQGQQAMLLMPTHANCGEVVSMFADAGVDAVAYPKRTTDGDAPNCWNAAADQAEALGLSVAKSVCPGCPFKEQCESSGHKSGVMKAKDTDVAVGTHARGAFQGLEELTAGRKFIVIEEDVVGLLRPSDEVSRDDLAEAVCVVNEVLRTELNRIAAAPKGDDQDAFLKHLADVADDLVVKLDSAESTIELPAIEQRDIPPGIEKRLLGRAKHLRKYAPVWRVLLAIASGHAQGFAVVNQTHGKRGGGGVPVIVKSLLAIWSNSIPADATVWLGDGTADADTIKKLLPAGVKFRDMTPGAKAPIEHKAVQIPRDVTRRTSAKTWGNVLRGVLADRPDAKKVGILHHSTHEAAAAELKTEDPRIGRTEYFGSGQDCSSNCWTDEEHDLIVIMGTPRTGPDAVRRYLLTIGEVEAAKVLVPVWEKFVWLGRTESGESVPVESRRYADPTWQKAFQAVCRAKLVQAIGRGRSICSDGAEVIVLASEECGLPVSDLAAIPMNSTESGCLAVLKRLSGESTPNPKNGLLANRVDSQPVRTGAIAAAVGINVGNTRGYLKSLESRGLVIHRGKAGWVPVAADSVPDSEPETALPPAETCSEASKQPEKRLKVIPGYDFRAVPVRLFEPPEKPAASIPKGSAFMRSLRKQSASRRE